MTIMVFRRLVYHDAQYPTSWVTKEISELISTYLTQRGFKEVNADNLAKIMYEMIRANAATNTVLVLAQDIVPTTIAHRPSPDTIMRRYLDVGGRVVWIGDVPFYYQGHFDEKTVNWGVIGEHEILKVYTRFTWPLHTDITDDGVRWGLKLEWTGYRPVDPLYSNLTHVLACSMAGTFAHAWFKNFNSDHPNSGFLRMWDYTLHDVSDRMLEELYNVSTYLLEQ